MKVEVLNPGEEKNFCVIDAAMNDMARPTLYQAWMDVKPVRPREGAAVNYDLVGPVCESGDWLARDRELVVEPGDLLAMLTAGAYGFTMASNYNTRGRAAEVLVDGEQVHLIRRREDPSELFALETIVK
jgi:diaminopimelate decarboxylase